MRQQVLVRDERVKGQLLVLLNFCHLSAGLRPLPPEVLFFFQTPLNSAGHSVLWIFIVCSCGYPVKSRCAVPNIAHPVSYCSDISIPHVK